MLNDEPIFEQLAPELNELTHGCIIVGHNVQFDYSFLRNEMKRIGETFNRKTLCTAELAQILHPGLRSYALAALCKLHEINNERPHRALPDAIATAKVFLKMADKKGADFFHMVYGSKSISKLIPSHLRETVYKQLPSTPGVYYFIGKNNKPFYIGKAAKIRNKAIV
jgi:DNA polymerase-3 subunit epsilon